jgi:hypothetical protein
MKVAKAKGRLRGKQPKLNHCQEAHLVSWCTAASTAPPSSPSSSASAARPSTAPSNGNATKPEPASRTRHRDAETSSRRRRFRIRHPCGMPTARDSRCAGAPRRSSSSETVPARAAVLTRHAHGRLPGPARLRPLPPVIPPAPTAHRAGASRRLRLGAAIAACRATRWLTTGGWCGVTESSSEQVLREDSASRSGEVQTSAVTARGKGQVSVGACRRPYSLEARRELGKSRALTR